MDRKSLPYPPTPPHSLPSKKGEEMVPVVMTDSQVNFDISREKGERRRKWGWGGCRKFGAIDLVNQKHEYTGIRLNCLYGNYII